MAINEIKKVVFIEACDEAVKPLDEEEMDGCASVMDITFNDSPTTTVTKRCFVGSNCPGKLPDPENPIILPPFHATFTHPDGYIEHFDLEDNDGQIAEYKRVVKGKTWYLINRNRTKQTVQRGSDKLYRFDKDASNASWYVRSQIPRNGYFYYTTSENGSPLNKKEISFGEEVNGYVRIIDPDIEHNAIAYFHSLYSIIFDDYTFFIGCLKQDLHYGLRVIDDTTLESIGISPVENLFKLELSRASVWTSACKKITSEELQFPYEVIDVLKYLTSVRDVPLYKWTVLNGFVPTGEVAFGVGRFYSTSCVCVDKFTGIEYVLSYESSRDGYDPRMHGMENIEFVRLSDLLEGEKLSSSIFATYNGSVLSLNYKFVDISVVPNEVYYGTMTSDKVGNVYGELVQEDTSIDE